MDEIVQVQTTFAARDDATTVARALVDARLAACVQLVGPITSTYRWRDAIEVAEEWLVLVKARRADYPALEAELRRLHPYEEPEILALPVVEGSRGYLDWVRAETLRPQTERA